MKFATPRPLFGKPTDKALTPMLAKVQARRTAQLAEAADVLTVIPGEGEALHALMTGRYDLMDLLAVLIAKIGGCTDVRIATLAYNARNLEAMVALLDAQAIDRLTLLASAFFRNHNKDFWALTREEFGRRNARAAAARSHCKVATLACRDGRRFTLEGSANLRTNSNREQFCLVRHAELHDWHAAWIERMVQHHDRD